MKKKIILYATLLVCTQQLLPMQGWWESIKEKSIAAFNNVATYVYAKWQEAHPTNQQLALGAALGVGTLCIAGVCYFRTPQGEWASALENAIKEEKNIRLSHFSSKGKLTALLEISDTNNILENAYTLSQAEYRSASKLIEPYAQGSMTQNNDASVFDILFNQSSTILKLTELESESIDAINNLTVENFTKRIESIKTVVDNLNRSLKSIINSFPQASKLQPTLNTIKNAMTEVTLDGMKQQIPVALLTLKTGWYFSENKYLAVENKNYYILKAWAKIHAAKYSSMKPQYAPGKEFYQQLVQLKIDQFKNISQQLINRLELFIIISSLFGLDTLDTIAWYLKYKHPEYEESINFLVNKAKAIRTLYNGITEGAQETIKFFGKKNN